MMTREHRQPDYHRAVDGTDITPRVKNGRLVSLTLTENRSDEAYTLNLVISDHDGQMALPRTEPLSNSRWAGRVKS